MKQVILIALLTIIFVASCKKNDPEPVPEQCPTCIAYVLGAANKTAVVRIDGQIRDTILSGILKTYTLNRGVTYNLTGDILNFGNPIDFDTTFSCPGMCGNTAFDIDGF